ncbi:hypothetical protein LEMLEM_LOCUS20330, partial [Lemmus lemmus]
DRSSCATITGRQELELCPPVSTEAPAQNGPESGNVLCLPSIFRWTRTGIVSSCEHSSICPEGSRVRGGAPLLQALTREGRMLAKAPVGRSAGQSD